MKSLLLVLLFGSCATHSEFNLETGECWTAIGTYLVCTDIHRYSGEADLLNCRSVADGQRYVRVEYAANVVKVDCTQPRQP